MPIFMQYPGVTGDVTEPKHTNWIEIKSLNWGMGRGIASRVGSGAEREASAPSISEVTLSKTYDTASIGLLTDAFQGLGTSTPVQIDFARTEKGNLEVFLTLKLTNTMISGYAMASGGDRPTENLTLNFTKIEVDYFQMNPDGTPGETPKVTYDLTTAAVV